MIIGAQHCLKHHKKNSGNKQIFSTDRKKQSEHKYYANQSKISIGGKKSNQRRLVGGGEPYRIVKRT